MQDIKTETIDENTVVINPGYMLDNSNAHLVVNIITKLQDEGYKYIIINMEKLEFISSAGIGSILGTIETSRLNGGDIIICSASETIIHIIDTLNLVDFFTIKKSVEEALITCGV